MPVFRHIKVRNFFLDPFQLKNHTITINDPEEAERFRDAVRSLPRYHRNCIVEIPDDAPAPMRIADAPARTIRAAATSDAFAAEKREKDAPVVQATGGVVGGAVPTPAASTARGPLTTEAIPAAEKKSS